VYAAQWGVRETPHGEETDNKTTIEEAFVVVRKTERKRKVTVVEDQMVDARPTAEIARERIGAVTESALASVAQTVGPALEDARMRLAPVAEQAIAHGKRQGRRAALKLGVVEEPEPEESHKIRNLMLMLGLGAIAAAVYKMMSGKDADPAWTARRDDAAAAPTSPVTVAAVDEPASAGVDPVVAEPAGSDPLMTAEPTSRVAGPIDGSETAPTAPLASEETVESSVPTTPDQPLERRDVT